MFWRKQKQPEAEPEKTPRQHGAKRFFKLLLHGVKYLFLFFFICVLAGIGGIVWITQSESGHAWVVKTVNSALAPAPDSKGPALKLTALSGSIPADFTFGIEVMDRHGVWLKAPNNSFVWNWRELPGTIRIKRITAQAVNVERMPNLPSSPSPPSSRPLSIEDIQNILAQATDFLAKKHWWLPAIRIDEIAVPNALLPPSILPAANKEPQRIAADAAANLAFVDNKADLQAWASLKNALGNRISTPSLNFQHIEASLKASAMPAPGGLGASLGLEARLGAPMLEAAGLPRDFLGPEPNFSLNIDAKAIATGDKPGIDIALTGPGLDAGHIQLAGNGQWHTDETWKNGQIAGPLACKLSLSLNPVADDDTSLLAPLKSPIHADVDINSHLPKLNLLVGLDCAEISQSGHTLADTRLALVAKDAELPLNAVDIHALEKENHIDIALTSFVDRHKVNISTELFFQALAQTTAADASGWRAGLRRLSINALGLQGAGDIAVLLPEGQKPGLDGKIRLEVKDWTDISAFTPGQSLSGNILVTAVLESGVEAKPGDGKTLAVPKNIPMRQQAHVKIEMPAFAMRSKDSNVEIAGMNALAALDDLFGAPAASAKLEAHKIAVAGMKLAASAKAYGPLAGPLKAELTTKGSVNSQIAAQWEPGKAEIDTLEVVADITSFMPRGKYKKLLAGIRSTQKAQISYGEGGIHVRNLNLRLLPSGKLRANGGVAPDKLDFSLDFQDFQLKPLQAVLPAIPAGVASLSASLGGSPARPSGQFRLNLKDIAIPQNSLSPMSFALTGNLEHGSGGASALKASLQLDPKTIRTLGGNAAQITASLPLIFGSDGVPKPNMRGPLAAKIRWDGALGPIWNLLPIADQRLNGRVAIDVNANGTLDAPRVTGKASISKGRYENLTAGVLLTDINLQVDLTDTGKGGSAMHGLPSGMKVNLAVSDGRGGTVTANGHGALDGSSLDIKAKINNLKPLRRRDVHIDLSGHAEVSGSATAPAIAGEIVINKGEVLLDNIAATSSITTLPIADPAQIAKMSTAKTAKPVPAKTQPPTKFTDKKISPKRQPTHAAAAGGLNIKITMLPRFHIVGRGLASIWKANLLVTGQLADPKVSGNISCVRGNFDFLGKNFALTKGVVFFGGGSLANPLVDIDLTNETPDLTAHILVTGPVSKIKLELASDPSVPRDEILSRVLFGRSVNDLSRAEALQLAGAVAQLAGFGGGGGLLGSAKKALGVDVLRIGTSNTGDESDNDAGGTNIEMGKYINDYIYMGVQQGLKPDSTAFIIEIELSPHANLELRTEGSNTWGGLKWKYNY